MPDLLPTWLRFLKPPLADYSQIGQEPSRQYEPALLSSLGRVGYNKAAVVGLPENLPDLRSTETPGIAHQSQTNGEAKIRQGICDGRLKQLNMPEKVPKPKSYAGLWTKTGGQSRSGVHLL